MEVPMQAIVTALGEEQAELTGLLSRLEDSDWQRASRCDGWTVADVVLHLTQTNELATATAAGRLHATVAELAAGGLVEGTVDDGAEALVARERGQPVRQLRRRWVTSAEEVCRVLGDGDPHRRMTWVAGEVLTRTLLTTRLAETWIHGGDVAHALGLPPTSTDRLWHVARLAWRTLPYAFGRAGRELSGPTAFLLLGPNEDGWDLVPDSEPVTVVRGSALELCLVAARRADPGATALVCDGPDPVLELVRTYA